MVCVCMSFVIRGAFHHLFYCMTPAYSCILMLLLMAFLRSPSCFLNLVTLEVNAFNHNTMVFDHRKEVGHVTRQTGQRSPGTSIRANQATPPSPLVVCPVAPPWGGDMYHRDFTETLRSCYFQDLWSANRTCEIWDMVNAGNEKTIEDVLATVLQCSRSKSQKILHHPAPHCRLQLRG